MIAKMTALEEANLEHLILKMHRLATNPQPTNRAWLTMLKLTAETLNDYVVPDGTDAENAHPSSPSVEGSQEAPQTT